MIKLLFYSSFAVFDRPGQDLFLAVSGKPAAYIDIQVIGGTFYQHPHGGDTAPLAALVSLVPALGFDTCVTIGVKSVGSDGQPEDNLTLPPGWAGFGPSSLVTGNGWAVTPSDPQADPFNPDFYAGDGHVLIGQFSTANGSGIVGMFRVLVVSSNVPTQFSASFSHFVASPAALALVGAAGLLGTRRQRAYA